MTRRSQLILAEARGDAAHGISTQSSLLPWSGTFHAIGSRLLRLHAGSIGLDSAFTVLDRADSADLLDLVRSEHGLSQTVSRFPRKDTCLAIYSYTVNASCPLEETLAEVFPWCAEWSGELRRLFQAYVARKQQDNVLDYGIAVRTGLHCAPAAHQAIGTFPEGTVRVGFGQFNTRGDVDALLAAVHQIRNMPAAERSVRA